MDYFDTFDCQIQCEEYYGRYEDLYSHEDFCTDGFYFEAPTPLIDNSFEKLFDEF
jgi:hypothetical protein